MTLLNRELAEDPPAITGTHFCFKSLKSGICVAFSLEKKGIFRQFFFIA